MSKTLGQRAKQLLSLVNYADAYLRLMHLPLEIEDVPKNQHILRMMIKAPWSNGWQVPPQLAWTVPAIQEAIRAQRNLRVDHPFVYITVRSGVVQRRTDDVWHVDGFSMRVPHVPEQNYIWTDDYPTEVLAQRFGFEPDFDPMVHNIHQYFQDRAHDSNVYVLRPKCLYQIDPYVVHRRPQIPEGTQRTFLRISFIPIEIEDDTCAPNPLLPEKVYGREDIRKKLIRYVAQNVKV